jgi:hypothetical protein
MITNLVATRSLLGKTNPTATMHRASGCRSSGHDVQTCPRDAIRSRTDASSATQTLVSEISLHRSRTAAFPSASQLSGPQAFMLHLRGLRLSHFRKELEGDNRFLLYDDRSVGRFHRVCAKVGFDEAAHAIERLTTSLDSWRSGKNLSISVPDAPRNTRRTRQGSRGSPSRLASQPPAWIFQEAAS